MNLSEKHASICWTADVVMVPIVGACFMMCGALMALLGHVTYNGKVVSYVDEPLKFTAIVAGTVGIGLLCVDYGAIRFNLARRRHQDA
jgi:hypothetical protein